MSDAPRRASPGQTRTEGDRSPTPAVFQESGDGLTSRKTRRASRGANVKSVVRKRRGERGHVVVAGGLHRHLHARGKYIGP